MDSQTCEIQMKSYAHTTNDVIYQWDDDPLQTETTLFTPEFTLEDWSLIYNCTGRTITGEYSCISVKFQLKRDIRFYLLKLYAPTVVVVLLSFLNFFIDPRAVPARVSIGLITVLTITTQSVSIQDRLPTVSYITAADVWLTACLLFVFGSMLEYTAVNVLLQKEKKREKKGIGALAGNINKAFRDSFSTDLNGSKVDLHVEVNGALGASEFDKPWLTMSNVDKVAKFVFFIGFAVFNIIYWSVYLIVQK
ncbi:glycine receptor subunit alpha-3 [Lingula anatina]|uniref:Glycine receptor subunit alpha-3 n=1 Tax=Lingula anatina TaxID=7574 RepID=A0A1S3K9Y3_LINAN|nr:glycine receptor subunit alpha-3 [Lingula anatina]|eukprot:XP_013419259.1 glycine receptor subunit alpha-3 [Lingula anatina]